MTTTQTIRLSYPVRKCLLWLGGFKNQPQQLMFSSCFSQFHVEQELAVNFYW